MKKTLLIILMIALMLPPVFAGEETVNIKITDMDVNINGNLINNSTEPYPFINYNDITYIPMTWDLATSLGLEVKWNGSTQTLEISKRDDMTVYQQTGYTLNDIKSSYKARIVKNKVIVNGVEIDNTNTDYPVLNFRDVTYFPLTWAYMVDEFNCGYNWTQETGLAITCDSKLDVHLPKLEVTTLEITAAEIEEKRLIANEHFIIRADDEYNETLVEVHYDTDPLKEDFIILAYATYYDTNGDEIMASKLCAGVANHAHESSTFAIGIGLTERFAFDSVKLTMELVPPSVAKARLVELDMDVAVEYFDTEIDYDKLVKEGVKYYQGVNYHYEHFDKLSDDIKPYAAYVNHANYIKDGVYSTLTITMDGQVNLEPSTEFYRPMSRIKALSVNPLAEDYYSLEGSIDDIVVTKDGSKLILLFDENHEFIKLLVKN